MRDFELYQAILGLREPWTVRNVDLDVRQQQVIVTVEAGPGPYPCPACQEPMPGYDRKPRRWRHLDTCQFTTWIQAEVPRVTCPTHGVKQIAVPWEREPPGTPRPSTRCRPWGRSQGGGISAPATPPGIDFRDARLILNNVVTRVAWLELMRKYKKRKEDRVMLVKWNPYSELERTVDDFFGRDVFRRPFWSVRPMWEGTQSEVMWKPAVNVYEGEEALHIEAQVPGIDMKDVNLSVNDHTLEIRGERKMEHEDNKEGYLYKEARYGTFARSFSLPSYVDPDKAKAHYDRGVLSVTIPKKEQAKPKTIPIEGK